MTGYVVHGNFQVVIFILRSFNIWFLSQYISKDFLFFRSILYAFWDLFN